MKRNLLDRFIEWYNPVRASERYRARAINAAMSTAFNTSDRSRRQNSGWNVFKRGDTDMVAEIPGERQYCQDLSRKSPIAAGILSTKLTHVVGQGFTYHARPDRKILRMSDSYADEWEEIVEREWSLFFNKKHCDIARTSVGNDLTKIIYDCVNVDGDILAIFPKVSVPGRPYSTRVQLVEADRLCNPNDEQDTNKIVGGVEMDEYGAPIRYHIVNYVAGSVVNASEAREWLSVDAFGKKTGLPNLVHIYRRNRPNRPRGIPSLSPVIEVLKMLTRYSEAELMAAVVSSYFTVFIQTETGEAKIDSTYMTRETGASSTDDNIKLGDAMVIGLRPNEKISTANPGRPNDKFDQFVLALFREIGIAVNIPYEILIKHFSSSYTASRGALLEFWKWVLCEREFLYNSFLYPVRDIFMWEAVSLGRIKAPGYFNDPILREAYNNGLFRGPARGHIDDLDEINAAIKRVESGVSTLDTETAEITGGNWERNHEQSVKEHRKRVEGGLIENETINKI